MGISRKLPTTNSGRLQTLKKAQTKVTNAPTGGNILSTTTTTRLATDYLAYKNGVAAITTAIRAQRKAILLAIPQRILLKDICNSYIKTLDNGIKTSKQSASCKKIWQQVDTALADSGIQKRSGLA